MNSSSKFWTTLVESAYSGKSSLDFAGNYLNASEKEAAANRQIVEAAVEARLSGRSMNEGSFKSVRALTDSGRAAAALQLPVEAGTRVQFAANVGSILSYENPPAPNASGIVVAVRSASGMVTDYGGRVFVRWDDNVIRPIATEHLRRATGRVRTTTAAMLNRIRVASLGDLSGFLRVAGTDDTLVHKATRDLWSVKRDGSEYVIERLFSDTGAPLKV